MKTIWLVIIYYFFYWYSLWSGSFYKSRTQFYVDARYF